MDSHRAPIEEAHGSTRAPNHTHTHTLTCNFPITERGACFVNKKNEKVKENSALRRRKLDSNEEKSRTALTESLAEVTTDFLFRFIYFFLLLRVSHRRSLVGRFYVDRTEKPSRAAMVFLFFWLYLRFEGESSRGGRAQRSAIAA